MNLCKFTKIRITKMKWFVTLLMGGSVLVTGCNSVAMQDDQVQVKTSSIFVAEHNIDPFMAEPSLKIQKLFDGQRFPNVTVTNNGTVLTTWGGAANGEEKGSFIVRRSEDGGKSWGTEIVVSEPGFQGGGVIADEQTGDILVFVEEGHPPAPFNILRSKDDGKTWHLQDFKIHPDRNGNKPSMHMNEAGITLHHGKYAGRLIRPSRFYAGGNKRSEWPNHYTNAIYSDDGGKTWHTSDPFPAFGTGEAALAELSDGTIYYNSRRHYSDDGLNPRRRHIAWSRDGGASWEDLSVSEILPDGRQDRDYGLFAGLTRLPVQGKDILLFSNIIAEGDRRNGHVWASFDGGKSWPVKRQIEKGGFAYSSLAAGRPETPSEGWIYLLYEDGGHPDANGYIARFNLSWLLEGELTGNGQLPEWVKR